MFGHRGHRTGLACLSWLACPGLPVPACRRPGLPVPACPHKLLPAAVAANHRASAHAGRETIQLLVAPFLAKTPEATRKRRRSTTWVYRPVVSGNHSLSAAARRRTEPTRRHPAHTPINAAACTAPPRSAPGGTAGSTRPARNGLRPLRNERLKRSGQLARKPAL